MKKIYQLLALITLLVSGCSQDEQIKNQDSSSNSLIYTASFEGSESRTYLNEDGYLRWTADDQISIFGANTYNQQYKFTGETGANSGTFEKVTVSYPTGTDLNHHYALYPYNSQTTISETGVITATIPADQTYAVNSFGLGDNTMVAVTKDEDDTFLKFKNVGGYLELKLYGDDVTVKSIKLEGNSDEKLAGNATITSIYGQDPTISMANDATKTITMDCGDSGIQLGTTAETATTFLLVVPPTTFVSGFTITVTDINGGEFTKSTSKSIEIKRNIIQPMNAFEVDCKTVISSNYSNGIAYVANAGELSLIIPDDEKLTITSLKISGYLNGDDIICLRKMLGSNEYSDVEKGKLMSIDLSEASIVEGGEWYYYASWSSNYYYASNNIIGMFMFRDCNNLQKIVLPSNVTLVDTSAFYNCTSLSSVIMGDNIISIGNYAFSRCSSLTAITISNDVTSIGNYAFSECSSLTSATIGDGVSSIGEYAFYNCSSLSSVTLGNGVTSIGNYAFSECSYLESINIPAGVSSIGEYAFNNCSSLSSVTLGDGITSIGDYAFYNCSSLTFIDIPSGSIGWNSFRFCSALTSVTMGNGVTSIAEWAFAYCTSLTSVTMGNGVTSIGEYAFDRCSSLTSIDIPAGVSSIGECVFNGCSALSSVTIGENVTSIGKWAFSGCSSLTNLYCYAVKPPTIYDNYVFSSNKTTIHVPTGCVAKYRATRWGTYFTNIIEIY